MKAIPKEYLQGGVFGAIVLIIIIIFLNSCAGSNAHFAIDQSEVKQRTGTGEIVRFPDGSKVPEGYTMVMIAEYITSALTMQCDYESMIKEAELATVKAGGDGYRLFNVKAPDNITTWCYSCNILILRREA